MTRPERLTLLDRHGEGLPLKTQAELLGLNRSGLYYQPLAPSAEEVALKHRIDELYTLASFLRLAPHHRHLTEGGLAAESQGSTKAHAGDGYPGDSSGAEPEQTPQRPPGLSLPVERLGRLPSRIRCGASTLPISVWLRAGSIWWRCSTGSPVMW